MTGRLFAAVLGSGSILMMWGAAAAATTTATIPNSPRKAEQPVAAPVTITSQPTYRRYVHPDAKAMAGLDWTRITSSLLGRKLAAQLDATGWKKKAAAEGLEFAADIEKLMLSSPGELTGQGEDASAKLSEDAPFVVSMQGRFKIDVLRKSLMARKAGRLLHQGAEVWMPVKTDVALAIVNAQMMLLGDRKSLRATLDAQAAEAEGSLREPNPVVERAGELAAQYDFWVVSEASLEGLSKAQGGAVAQAQMLEEVDRFELGVSLRQGLKADISLHGRTPEASSKLGTMLAGVKAMLALSTLQKKDPELTALLDKLKVGMDEDRVVLSVEFSQKEVDRGYASFTGNKTKGTEVASASAAVVSKQPGPQPPQPTVLASASPLPAPAAPAPLIVRIYNAEGGTREVSLTR